MQTSFPHLLIRQSPFFIFKILLSQPWPLPLQLSCFHRLQKCICWNRMWTWCRISSCSLQTDRRARCHYCLRALAAVHFCLRFNTWPALFVIFKAFSIAKFRHPSRSSSSLMISPFSNIGFEWWSLVFSLRSFKYSIALWHPICFF